MVYDFQVNNVAGAHTIPNMIEILYGYNETYHANLTADYDAHTGSKEPYYLEL